MGNSWVWGEVLACDGEAALLFTDPFTSESPGEMHVQAIKIARNLVKTKKALLDFLHRDSPVVWCTVGGKRGLLLDIGEDQSKKLWMLE